MGTLRGMRRQEKAETPASPGDGTREDKSIFPG